MSSWRRAEINKYININILYTLKAAPQHLARPLHYLNHSKTWEVAIMANKTLFASTRGSRLAQVNTSIVRVPVRTITSPNIS